MSAGSGRAVPFHCAYCGDENLFPHESADGPGHGEWECRSCLRVFKINMITTLPRPASASTGGGRA